MEYAAQKQQWIIHSAGQLAVQLQAVERAHNTLQINSRFTDFMQNSAYPPVTVYEYIKYINYCLSDIKAIDSHIEGLVIYTDNAYLPRLRSEFVENTYAHERFRRGSWALETKENGAQPSFVYRKNLYESRFAKWLGVLEIMVDPGIVPVFFDLEQEPETMHLLLSEQLEVMMDESGLADHMTAQEWGTLLGTAKGSGEYLRTKSLTFNTVYLENLHAYCVIVEPSSQVWGNDLRSLYGMLWVALLAMLALSLLYVQIIARMMRRIDRLSRHIRHTNGESLSTINGGHARDEVGYLYISFNAMVERINELMDSLQKARRMQQDAAYAALQAKVQPHFLYGTLETIRMLALRNSDREVAELAFSFGQLMRYSLGDSAEVTLAQEFCNTLDFLRIKKTRMDDRLVYQVNLPANLEKVVCPRFIVQPVVENAITHGVGNLLRKGEITVTAQRVGTEIHVIVRDNGVGLTLEEEARLRASLEDEVPPARPNAPGNGFGLRSVHHRLKQYYDPSCGIRVEAQEGVGMVVTMVLKEGTSKC